MKTLEIEIPEGYELDTLDKVSGKIKFKEKPKDVLQRINTDEDVLADNGYTLYSFNKWCEGLRSYERADRFLELLHKSLNGDWVPDFDNSNQPKWRPWFTGGSRGFRYVGYGSWRSVSGVGSRLCLKEERLAIHAGTKFTSWFKQSIII
jgi:hypothetical protein